MSAFRCLRRIFSRLGANNGSASIVGLEGYVDRLRIALSAATRSALSIASIWPALLVSTLEWRPNEASALLRGYMLLLVVALCALWTCHVVRRMPVV